MRRRLLVTLLLVVTAGLLSAGVGTFAIARRNATADAERLAVQRAEALAAATTRPGIGRPGDVLPIPRDRLRNLSRSLDVRQIGVFAIGEGGATRVLLDLPDGLDAADLEPAELLEAGTTSGRSGGSVFGAAVMPVPGDAEVALAFVVTVDAGTDLGRAGGWFLVASAGTLLLAVGASIWLSRGLSRPVVEAAGAARRIADGDLSTRLTEPDVDRTDELAELARAVNAMASGLERSRGLERQFLLSVSHDLRTPLTSIRGWSEALADGTAEDAAATGRVIGTEAARLDRLVRDLLDLARFDADRFRLEPAPVDLAPTTRHAAVALAPSAGDVELHVVVPDHPVVAVADADRWSQVVGNLVENGLRHARSRLEVRLEAGDGRAVLRVADDGTGIDAADLPHIFERLYVSRSTPPARESGSGLGLAIVRELVHAMGGEVHAESTPGEGATLVVALPLA